MGRRGTVAVPSSQRRGGAGTRGSPDTVDLVKKMRVIRASALVLGAVVACAADVFNIATSCGAKGDNSTMNTAAIQQCIDQAMAHVSAGGRSATVLVPAGIFLTGAVTLSGPNLSLVFADGGYLQGSRNASDYGLDWDWWHVVTVVNATSFTATGVGTGGIVGNLWQMVAGWNPSEQSYTPANWVGYGGCVGECRAKNLAVVDSRDVCESQHPRHALPLTRTPHPALAPRLQC